MLSAERMKKIELLVLGRDVDSVLRYLGFAGCLQLIAEAGAQRELTAEEKEVTELRLKVESLARFLGMEPFAGGRDAPGSAKGPSGASRDSPGATRGDAATAQTAVAQAESIDREKLREAAAAIIADTRDLVEEEDRLLQEKLNLSQTVSELESFAGLKVAFSELEHLTYLAFRMGRVPAGRVAELSQLLGKRALVVPLAAPGLVMAIAPRKGRWALDSELKRFEFQESRFPAGLKGVPSEILPAIRVQLARSEESLARLQSARQAYREAHERHVRSLLRNLEIDTSIDSVKQRLASTGSVQRITGWVPRRQFREVVSNLSSLTRGSIAVRVFEPEELAEVRSGKAKVPVSITHGPLVKSFERMVFSYSLPLYGTIDPTPFVAVMFVILFAIMFGDVGQGFVGLLVGLAINSGWFSSLERYRRKSFGLIFVVVGIASMLTGFMYGSLFGNEKVLIPVSRFLTALVIGRPLNRIVSIQGFDKILVFFGVTIGIGAIINSVGIVINIINSIRAGNWERAILSKTGAAGAVFFWYLLFIAVRILLGGRFLGIDAIFLAIPLLALFFREPLGRLMSGARPLVKEGAFTFVMEGIVEILEAAIYYVSNSISFLRVAAFALAHTVLASIVILLAEMVGQASGGVVFSALVVVVGNAVIIVLEGLIVTIQVVRLSYYEFFSKFFTESGEEFTPFTLHSSGGL